jgi:hypothetical protein
VVNNYSKKYSEKIVPNEFFLLPFFHLSWYLNPMRTFQARTSDRKPEQSSYKPPPAMDFGLSLEAMVNLPACCHSCSAPHQPE